MGYVEIFRGGPYLERIENDQVKYVPSTDVCVACNDDRLIHSDGKPNDDSLRAVVGGG